MNDTIIMISDIKDKPAQFDIDQRKTVKPLLSSKQKWLLWFVICTFLGLTEAGRIYYSFNIDAVYFSWFNTIFWGLSDWYLWFCFTPFIYIITKKIGFDRKNVLLKILIHIICALILSLIQIFLDTSISHFAQIYIFKFNPEMVGSLLSLYEDYLREMLQRGILIYLLIAFAIYAINFYEQFRTEELRRSKAETRLSQAQLETLKGQLHPHFLFNTLNAISALIHTNPKLADDMIAKLGDLLRATLEKGGVQEIPLKEEIEFVERYLEIQKVRFQDRLEVKIEMAQDTLDSYVPNLILQPLIENAIIHGITPNSNKGLVELKSYRDNKSLIIIINDDGKGIDSDKLSENNGLGLKNTQDRLLQLYKQNHNFKIESSQGKGTTITITIPYRLKDNSSLRSMKQ